MNRLPPLPKELSADIAQSWRLAVVQILGHEEAVAIGKQKVKPNYHRRVLLLPEWIIAMLYLRSSSQYDQCPAVAWWLRWRNHSANS